MYKDIYVVNQENTAWRIVDGEVVVINAVTTYYFTLNESGSLIWQLLLEGTNVDSATQQLASHYGEQDTQLRPQVERFFESLEEEELILRDAAVGAHDGLHGRLPATPAQAGNVISYLEPQLVKYDTLEKLVVSGE